MSNQPGFRVVEGCGGHKAGEHGMGEGGGMVGGESAKRHSGVRGLGRETGCW